MQRVSTIPYLPLLSGYCYHVEDISDLKILLNASAGQWKRCGGPHMARGRLFAHPWFTHSRL